MTLPAMAPAIPYFKHRGDVDCWASRTSKLPCGEPPDPDDPLGLCTGHGHALRRWPPLPDRAALLADG